MRAQQKNRPSAWILSYHRTTNDPLLRIVPTTTNAEEEIGDGGGEQIEGGQNTAKETSPKESTQT